MELTTKPFVLAVQACFCVEFRVKFELVSFLILLRLLLGFGAQEVESLEDRRSHEMLWKNSSVCMQKCSLSLPSHAVIE